MRQGIKKLQSIQAHAQLEQQHFTNMLHQQKFITVVIICFLGVVHLTLCFIGAMHLFLLYFKSVKLHGNPSVSKSVNNSFNKSFTFTHKAWQEAQIKNALPVASHVQRIPKHIHQYWNGKNAPYALMKHCRDMHPDWNYTLWTPETIDKLPLFHNRDMFHQYGKGEINGQSDIVRFSVLREMGGVYIDADTLCLQPLDPFLKYGFFASYEMKGNLQSNIPESELVATGVIGGVAQHPILIQLTDQLENKSVSGPAWKQVGPHYMMRILAKCSHCNASGDVHILPYHTFVPYHHSEKNSINFAQPHLLPKVKQFGSFAINLWGSTFKHWNSLSKLIPASKPVKTVKQVKLLQNKVFFQKHVLFSIESIFIQQKCHEEDVTFGVLSHTYEGRARIRATWGNISCVLFLVGKVNGIWPQEEAWTHKDMVLIDKEEIYSGWNSILPFKTAIWFHVAMDLFPKAHYYLKTDDDSYIKTKELHTTLMNAQPEYWGKTWHNVGTNRDKQSPWFMPTDMYSLNVLPEYCSGAGYALSRRALMCYNEHVTTQYFVSNEDVATGLVMKSCLMQPMNSNLIFIDNNVDLKKPWTIVHGTMGIKMLEQACHDISSCL